jgi:N-acetylglucosamine-6-sulfatase
MQESGYNTYYTGKLYNAITTDNYNDPPVKGYTENELFLDPYTYQYYNISTSRNGEEPRYILDKYSPDFTAEVAHEFLDLGLSDSEKPWFLTVAPIASHAEGSGSSALAPGSAERHKDLFTDYQIPRGENFNPDEPSGVSWVSRLAQLNETVLEYNDEFQRQRLRSLQAVDEMVGSLVEKLDEAGVLDNTHIFYSSDNGYHISQHRLHPGKMLGLETDINVPLVWAGPGVPEGKSMTFPTSHSNIAPTLMKIAGLSYDDREFDGEPLVFQQCSRPRSEHISVEYWGPAAAESLYAWNASAPPPLNIGAYLKNTYKGLRMVAEEYGFYYSVWCTDERELYDMKVSCL